MLNKIIITMVKPQLLLGYDLMSHVTFRIIQYSQKEIMRLIFYFSTVFILQGTYLIQSTKDIFNTDIVKNTWQLTAPIIFSYIYGVSLWLQPTFMISANWRRVIKSPSLSFAFCLYNCFIYSLFKSYKSKVFNL